MIGRQKVFFEIEPYLVSATRNVLPSHKVKSPRTLLPELEHAIDAKLMEKWPTRILEAIEKKDGNETCHLADLALNELKIREHGGNNRGKLVGLIQAVIGIFKKNGDGLAWCMSARQIAVAYAEKKTGKVSLMPASESCASVRKRCPVKLIVKPEDSRPGDQWVWVYTTGSRKGLGHTGGFGGWKKLGEVAYVYEGNTEKGLVGGKVERDGGGFYLTERELEIPGMRLAMVIRPF